MDLLSTLLREETFYNEKISHGLLNLIFSLDIKQYIFLILLIIFLGINQLKCNQKQLLRPNLIRY